MSTPDEDWYNAAQQRSDEELNNELSAVQKKLNEQLPVREICALSRRMITLRAILRLRRILIEDLEERDERI